MIVSGNCLFQITSEEETFKVGFLYSSLDSERWPEGFSAIYSAEIALKRIEAANILPKGVKIELVPEATDCDPMRARDSVLRLLNENDVKMFIGKVFKKFSACSVSEHSASFSDQLIFFKKKTRLIE